MSEVEGYIIRHRGDLPLETDCIVALGRNIGVGWTPDNIRHDPDYLSNDSRLITRALGSLLLDRPHRFAILSGGKTAGSDYPSQPMAALSYLQRMYPGIPLERIILEEGSIDTAGSAEHVPSIIQKRKFQHVGLISVGYHLKGAATLFRNYGMPIKTLIAAEDIVAGMSEQDSIDMKVWRESSRVAKETKKERLRGIILKFDPQGQMVRKIAERTRR